MSFFTLKQHKMQTIIQNKFETPKAIEKAITSVCFEVSDFQNDCFAIYDISGVFKSQKANHFHLSILC